MKPKLALLGLVLLAVATVAPAAERTLPACTFKWNVAREVSLFAGEARRLTTGESPADAPALSTEQLYALDLKPQEGVQYAVPASKKMLPDGAFGGVVHLRVEKAGQYRVSVDSGFWLDVAYQGKALPAVDFNGSQTCPGPRKIVIYDLPANEDLILQIGNATSASAKLTVTAIDAAN